jgi:hypothetical protein
MPLLVLLAAAATTTAGAVLRNDRLMRDSTGAAMDAHMLDIHRWQPSGPWYLYAMQFGTCLDTTCCDEGCGCRTDVNLTVHTSSDLSDGSWVRQSSVAVAPSQRPANATFGRPKVMYNAASKRYVLWVNWFPFINGAPAFMSSAYQTLTSATPAGPFINAVLSVPMLYPAGGDLGLFTDADGAGYVIYTSIAAGHRVSIEKLTADFTNTTQNNSGLLPFPSGGFESPLLFSRGNAIYALSAPCCCNCAEGSTVMALRSKSGIFGPFVPAGATMPAPHGPHLSVASPPPPRTQCKLLKQYPDDDYIGGDICEFNMSTVAHGADSLAECAAACCKNPLCQNFGTLLDPPVWPGAGTCADKPPCSGPGGLCCYLKNSSSALEPSKYAKGNSVAGSVTASSVPPRPPSPSPPAPVPCPRCVVSNLNHSQQGTVVAVPSEHANGEVNYLWLGDRWKSAPDHRKGHDLTAFSLLNFSADGGINQLQWATTVTLL